MKKNIFVVCIAVLCIHVDQLLAAPKNSKKTVENTHVTPKVITHQKKVDICLLPLDLIKAYNFWIGCAPVDRAQDGLMQDTLADQVKKLFSVHDYEDTEILASIPNDIDFVILNNDVSASEQVLRAWYAKIRPGGMLICTQGNSAFKEQIYEMFQDQNALFKCVNNDLWYIQKKHVLSCIIPTYNRAHTLSIAIDSLYNQNLNIPFEVIVTDDASTDETQKILNQYKQKYDNFHFYVHEVNGGASKARNTCIAHAQGDLIFNLDSDNYLETRSLQGLIDLLDMSGCDAAAFGKIKYFYQAANGRKTLSHLWHYEFPHNICSFASIFGNARIPTGSGNYLFTKKSYDRAKGYNGRTVETWRFGYKQLATGAKIAILPNTYYWHRLSSDGKWNSNEALRKNNPAIFKTCMQYSELIVHNKKFYASNDSNFLGNIEKGAIKPIAVDALEHLFSAYRYEELGLFDDAVQEYDRAIQKGAWHENVHKRRRLAAQKILP